MPNFGNDEHMNSNDIKTTSRRQRKEAARDFLSAHREFQRREREFHRLEHEMHREKYGHQNKFDYDEFEKLEQDYRKKQQEYLKHHQEIHHYNKFMMVTRPVSIILIIAIWYVLFKFTGFQLLAMIFASLVTISGVFQMIFQWRLEKRVFKPIEKLKAGVNEISKGNYNVKVECDVTNDITLLVASFNEMAEKLLESEKLKDEYEDNRKMLIANISHDLKTPITSIQGYIEAILEGAVTSEEKMNQYLGTIGRNTAYINKLIDDLFLFSKLDMQKLDFQFESLPIKSYMNDIMEEFKFELEEKQCKFRFVDRIMNDCIVHIDRKRMHQAMWNIIGNAVKYGPENDLSIQVQMQLKDEFIYIDISDNGPGIAKDKLSHLFDRFYRIDTERTKDTMSTGLGLAIAKELVEAHDGKLSVTSEEGKGSVFTILLPVKKIQEETK